MSQVQNRRHFVAALLGGTALVWLGARQNRTDASNALNVPQLALEQAKALIDAGAIVLDVRGDEQFQHRHIPVAMLMPLDILQAAIPAWLSTVKDQPIVVYCGDGVSHGPEATRILVRAGFSRAANLTAGIDGWDKAGYPVKRA